MYKPLIKIRSYYSSLPPDTRLFIAISVLAAILRFIVAYRGWNFDLGCWMDMSKAMASHDNPYKLKVLNYGPGFPIVLHLMDWLPGSTAHPYWSLHYKVVTLLTMVDVGIAYLLWRDYSLRAAAILLLNPISIIITGYANQIDNIYVLLGLIAVRMIRKKEPVVSYAGLSVLGVSLIIKHGLILFPVWLAIKAVSEKKMRVAVVSLAIPYAMFFLSFVPFAFGPGMADQIRDNVFMFQSWSNAPLFWSLPSLWSKFTSSPFPFGSPQIFVVTQNHPAATAIPFRLWLFALGTLGVCLRKRKLEELFLLYLLSVLIFSPAVNNHHLAIAIAAIAVYPNILFMLYLLLGGIYLTGDNSFGLGYHWVWQEIHTITGINNKWHAIQVLIRVLFFGFILLFSKEWWKKIKKHE